MRRRILLTLCGLVAVAIWAFGVDAYAQQETVLGTALILVGGAVVVCAVALWRQGREGAGGTIAEALFTFFSNWS